MYATWLLISEKEVPRHTARNRSRGTRLLVAQAAIGHFLCRKIGQTSSKISGNPGSKLSRCGRGSSCSEASSGFKPTILGAEL